MKQKAIEKVFLNSKRNFKQVIDVIVLVFNPIFLIFRRIGTLLDKKISSYYLGNTKFLFDIIYIERRI